MSERDITKLELVVEIYERVGEHDSLGPITANNLDGKTELEPLVDADLAKFAEFYQKKLNDRLSKFEMAAIKTYLYWKTHPETA